jgi:hypothetical protein
MSIVNLVIKIFRAPSPQETVLQSQRVPVERIVDPEFEGITWEDRNPSQPQDKAAQLRATTWVSWRNV